MSFAERAYPQSKLITWKRGPTENFREEGVVKDLLLQDFKKFKSASVAKSAQWIKNKRHTVKTVKNIFKHTILDISVEALGMVDDISSSYH